MQEAKLRFGGGWVQGFWKFNIPRPQPVAAAPLSAMLLVLLWMKMNAPVPRSVPVWLKARACRGLGRVHEFSLSRRWESAQRSQKALSS